MVNGKVLIVEDQPNFRKGLAKMIESGGLGWDVIGEASNGQDALAFIDRLKPDLVLTDIRMPVMDGLEFVGHLRQHHPELIVIILTGYKSFEYAQAAVRLGAIDLLIKPCTEQDVRHVLGKASKLFYEQYAQQQKQLVHQRLQQEQELRAAMLDLPTSYGYEQRLRPLLDGKEMWYVQLNEEDLANKNDRSSDRSLLQFAFSNIVEEVLREAGEDDARLLSVENDSFVLIVSAESWRTDTWHAIESHTLQYLRIRVTAWPMGPAPSAGQLAERYATIKAAAEGESEQQSDEKRFIDLDLAYSTNQVRVKELEVQLMSAILLGQADSLQPFLERQISELQDKRVEERSVHAMTLAIALQRTAHHQFEAEHSTVKSGIRREMLPADWTNSQVTEWARAQVRDFLDLFNRWQESKSDNVIEKAVKYIEEHYEEACRLADVASYVHLNPSYFSVLFKKMTGESFTKYVTRIRMDKAALLLRSTDMRISEIAGAVGFEEPNYFTNVFKQQFDMSPKEYRKQQ